MRARPGLYRYARLTAADDFLKLGWCIAAELGPVHGYWSVLMFWPCSCAPKVPA